ncbi:MAG: oxidoreductase [Bacteroidota bacterium]|nr:oxidoreductase [Bacteroidota bacterium]
MEFKVALIAGATGMVGKELQEQLLKSNHYRMVISLVRKQLPSNHPKLQQIIVNYDKLDAIASQLIADDYYCCLGTTMKKAGSKENFAKVDYLYPVNLASIAEKNKAKKYLLISAMGADKNSSIFYNKVKGEVEEGISQKAIKSIYIFRPSLLVGDREEERVGEKIATKIMVPISKLMVGPLKNYKPIHAREVAEGMINMAQKDEEGVHIFTSEEIKHIE